MFVCSLSIRVTEALTKEILLKGLDLSKWGDWCDNRVHWDSGEIDNFGV